MPLADPGDPFVTTKGEVILSEQAPIEDIVIGPPKASNVRSSVRRSMTDLPADPKSQTAINVVLMYSLLGLTENEIAFAIGAPLDDVKRLRLLPTYQETFDMLFDEMITINSSSMQAKIAAFAPKALENMMHIANKAENENAKMKANADLMDRAGLHHETLFGKNSIDDGFGSLKIVIQDGIEAKTNIEVNVGRRK